MDPWPAVSTTNKDSNTSEVDHKQLTSAKQRTKFTVERYFEDKVGYNYWYISLLKGSD